MSHLWKNGTLEAWSLEAENASASLLTATALVGSMGPCCEVDESFTSLFLRRHGQDTQQATFHCRVADVYTSGRDGVITPLPALACVPSPTGLGGGHGSHGSMHEK